MLQHGPWAAWGRGWEIWGGHRVPPGCHQVHAVLCRARSAVGWVTQGTRHF